MPVLKRIAVPLMWIPLLLLIGSCGGSDGPLSTAPREETPAVPAGLALAPIEGLTTQWHVLIAGPEDPGEDGRGGGRDGVAENSVWRPDEIRLPVPRDVPVTLSVSHTEAASVLWTGASEVDRTRTTSLAVCRTEENREMVVTAFVRDSLGEREYRVVFEVVDIAVEDISVRLAPTAPMVFDLPEGAPNEATMAAYYGESIADFRQIAPRSYLTSVGRNIDFGLQVEPYEMGPIMEWRVPGEAAVLGRNLNRSFDSPGTRRVSVGPPRSGVEVEIQTYAVEITSHVSNVDKVPEGIPVTFTAVTDPPGYEDGIRWLSSTKFGTASPTTGTGPSFTVVFRNTWGYLSSNRFQWLGVKADGKDFNVDAKTLPTPTISSFSPSMGGPGTAITVLGSNFGTDPDDICIALEYNNRLIGLDITFISDNSIVAVLPFVPSTSENQMHNLHVIRADGRRLAPPLNLVPGVEITGSTPWIWAYDGETEVTAPGLFEATPSAAPGVSPDLVTKNFHSGPPTGGTVQLVLDQDWDPGQSFRVSARVHRAGTGSDTNFSQIAFTGGGTRQECAEAFCTYLEWEFRNHQTRPLPVTCNVTPDGGNYRITMSLDTGTIDQGNLDIVLQ